MTGPELYRLCKQLADDPDNTFMTQSDWASALQQGYAAYQNYVANLMPDIYEKTYDFTLTGQSTYDLDGILFGENPSQGKVAYRLTKLHTVNVGNTPEFGQWVTPASTMEQLWAITGTTGYGNFNPGKWMLQGTKILFNIQNNGVFRLYYIPNPYTATEWASKIVTAGSFIDNTPDFAQQAIAYFAYEQYAIKDWSENPALSRKFQELLQQIDQWVAKNRTGDSHRWVQPGRQGRQGANGSGGGFW